jgi:hypothetical protein
MAFFMTRVELHEASYLDYNKLHAAMEQEGFSRSIQAADGHWYQLPPAEYHRGDSMKRDDVLESAKKAAATTQKSYAVCVTEAVSSTWVGLPIVQ